jgi:hypothetical protein
VLKYLWEVLTCGFLYKDNLLTALLMNHLNSFSNFLSVCVSLTWKMESFIAMQYRDELDLNLQHEEHG